MAGDIDDRNGNGKSVGRTILTVVLVLLLLIVAVWAVQAATKEDPRPVDETSKSVPPGETPDATDTPAEPTNPNVTGGSSGAGTGTSNDTTAPTPSPAGGVDTNNAPAGGQ